MSLQSIRCAVGRNRVVCVIIAVVTVLFGVQLVRTASQLLIDQSVRKEVMEWVGAAKAAADVSWKVEDATSWLRDNGFSRISAGESVRQKQNDVTENRYVVMGNREIKNEGFLVRGRPASFILTFAFTPNRRFSQVEYALISPDAVIRSIDFE